MLGFPKCLSVQQQIRRSGGFLLNTDLLCSGNGDKTYQGSLDNYFVYLVVFEPYISLLLLFCQFVDLDPDNSSYVFLQDLFCLALWPFYFIFAKQDLWDRLINIIIWGILEAVPLNKLLKAVFGVYSLVPYTIEFLQDICSFV